MKNINKEDKLPMIWFMLSNMFPPIGFFLYFKHRNIFPKKAKRALIGAFIGIPMGMVMGYLFNNYSYLLKDLLVN